MLFYSITITMQQIWKNLKLILSRKKYLLFCCIGCIVFLYLGFHFFDYKLSIGNLGYFWTYVDIISHIGISILFSLFLSGQIYKIRHVGNVNIKTTGTGVF